MNGELQRVTDSIGDVVMEFFKNHVQAGNMTFHAQELRDYVWEHVTTAPASPDRVMRALRADGVLSYDLVSRRKSEYRINWVFS